MTHPKQYYFSDLTIGEIKILTKNFFTISFFYLLLLGIPYALLVGAFWGAESVFSGGPFSWLLQAAIWGLVVYVVVLIFKDLPDVLKSFGDMFLSLSATAANISRVKQLIGLAFVIGYFYSAITFPIVWFWFSVLVFIPAGCTYDRYKKILKQKVENQISQDTSTGTA